jgi:hypothetical protein
MGTQITAPEPTLGQVDMHFGQSTIRFYDGVAEVDFEINDGLASYLRVNGYGVGDRPARTPEDTTIAVSDPREDKVTLVGTPLRDAAVDPRPEDYLPPINAGNDNPHGLTVVAPGIHGVGPGPIAPGTVGSAAYQQAKESDIAKAVLVDGSSSSEVMDPAAVVALAEYDLTKNGQAQELTPEERDLLGLDDAEQLKGQALHEALVNAGLSTKGTAAEKRQRLAELVEPEQV